MKFNMTIKNYTCNEVYKLHTDQIHQLENDESVDYGDFDIIVEDGQIIHVKNIPYTENSKDFVDAFKKAYPTQYQYFDLTQSDAVTCSVKFKWEEIAKSLIN